MYEELFHPYIWYDHLCWLVNLFFDVLTLYLLTFVRLALEGPAGTTTPQAKSKAKAKAKAKVRATPGQVQEQGQKTLDDVRNSPKLRLINVFLSECISCLILSSCGLRWNPEEGYLATQQCDLGIAKECFADKP